MQGKILGGNESRDSKHTDTDFVKWDINGTAGLPNRKQGEPKEQCIQRTV